VGLLVFILSICSVLAVVSKPLAGKPGSPDLEDTERGNPE
jgi:hypothetical protein